MDEDQLHNYVYVFVRDDLSWPQKAVQSGHAILEYFRQNPYSKELLHPSIIILAIKNENGLYKVLDKLKENNINFTEFREPDIGNQLTSICCEPVNNKGRTFFRKYQLLKEHKHEEKIKNEAVISQS